jgi:hypothetical protein
MRDWKYKASDHAVQRARQRALSRYFRDRLDESETVDLWLCRLAHEAITAAPPFSRRKFPILAVVCGVPQLIGYAPTLGPCGGRMPTVVVVTVFLPKHVDRSNPRTPKKVAVEVPA